MSVCALLLVKDEADIIETTIRHLAGQVDGIIVADNDSTDGTWDVLHAVRDDLQSDVPIHLRRDPEPAYWQSLKMTELAGIAYEQGFDWGLFCDADEMWVADDGRRIRDWLFSIPPDVACVTARIFHYLPTAEDPDDESPFDRIRWRLSEPSSLPKVGARLVPGLVVEAGNHGVLVDGERPPLAAGGLRVNHFSWRSEEQFAQKVVNGARAYALTDLPESVGTHWRMWGDPFAEDLPERAAAHFRRHFFAENPPCAPGSNDERGLVYDPAPPTHEGGRMNEFETHDGEGEAGEAGETGGDGGGEAVEHIEGQEAITDVADDAGAEAEAGDGAAESTGDVGDGEAGHEEGAENAEAPADEAAAGDDEPADGSEESGQE